jgi:hypothetical protein
MIIYSVSITLQPSVESEWLEWMRSVHIPDVLRTGCFVQCHIYKVAEQAADEPSYVMQYRCASLADYQRYRDNFAPALQKDHTDRFSGRFRASRQILEEVTRVEP